MYRCHMCFNMFPSLLTSCPVCEATPVTGEGAGGGGTPMEIVEKYYVHLHEKGSNKIKSDGGPSKYYDFPKGAKTLNDLLEFKGDNQWLGDTFHLANVVKAAWRWGDKEGTTKEYDARKLIYSGCRLLMKYAGVKAVREALQNLLDDEQFKEKD